MALPLAAGTILEGAGGTLEDEGSSSRFFCLPTGNMVPSSVLLCRPQGWLREAPLPLAGSWAVVRCSTAEGRLPLVPLAQYGGDCLWRTPTPLQGDVAPALGLRNGTSPDLLLPWGSAPCVCYSDILAFSLPTVANLSLFIIPFLFSYCVVSSPDCTMIQKYWNVTRKTTSKGKIFEIQQFLKMQ